MLRQFVEKKIPNNMQTTIGVDLLSTTVNVDGTNIKCQIWDTAGQENYYAIAKAYFREALGVLLVFDICERKSFDQLPKWLRDARMEADVSCTAILIGNKLDRAAERTVSSEEAAQFAKANDLLYMETSAVDNTNIEETFLKMCADILKKVKSGTIRPELVVVNQLQNYRVQPQTTQTKIGGCSC